VKNHKSVVFGIVACEESVLELSQCEIKGNKNKETIG
jgi:hypothetical protein